MAISRQVILSLLGISAIGWALAVGAPPHWQACELILLLGAFALLWEYRSAEKNGKQLSRLRVSKLPSRAAWFGGAPGDLRDREIRVLRPWDVEQSALRLSAFRITRAARRLPDTHGSVEQLADEMLSQAFRQPR